MPFINEEIVDEKAHIEEFCFLGLRMAKGIDKEIFKQKFNTDIESLYGEILPNLEKDGLIINTQKYIYLTSKGMKFGNQVFSEFLLD